MGHWDAVLAELLAEREKLDALINIATQRAGQTGNGVANEAGGLALRSDTFFGMKAPEAIRRFLEMVKSPKPPKDIADALLTGGYQSTSKDLTNSLRTALRRMSKSDDVVQVGSDWGLAEWYPGRQRKKGRTGGDESPTPTTEAAPSEP